MFELDKESVDKIQRDYSIFHPSANQMKILTEVAKKVSEKTSLDPILIRFVYIKAIVKQQISEQNFHFEFEDYIPQVRIHNSMKTMDYLKSEFLEILSDPNDIDKFMSLNLQVLELYVENYAGRTPHNEIE